MKSTHKIVGIALIILICFSSTIFCKADSNDFVSGGFPYPVSLDLQYFEDARQVFGNTLFLNYSHAWNGISSKFNIANISYGTTDQHKPIRVHATELYDEAYGLLEPWYVMDAGGEEVDRTFTHFWCKAVVYLNPYSLSGETTSHIVEAYVHELGHVASLTDILKTDNDVDYGKCIMTGDGYFIGYTSPQSPDRVNLLNRWR